jgi:hypothetical protein
VIGELNFRDASTAWRINGRPAERTSLQLTFTHQLQAIPVFAPRNCGSINAQANVDINDWSGASRSGVDITGQRSMSREFLAGITGLYEGSPKASEGLIELQSRGRSTLLP